MAAQMKADSTQHHHRTDDDQSREHIHQHGFLLPYPIVNRSNIF
jgi:hypothetical protein